MKVNVGIDLSDDQRDVLADWLDSKTSKRLATRKDVVALVEGLVAGIVDAHAASYIERSGEAEPAPEVNYVDCEACGGLGCDGCNDGVVTVSKSEFAEGWRAGARRAWEDHPNLTTYATEIAAGLEAKGWTGGIHEDGYRKGWTLPAFKLGN